MERGSGGKVALLLCNKRGLVPQEQGNLGAVGVFEPQSSECMGSVNLRDLCGESESVFLEHEWAVKLA